MNCQLKLLHRPLPILDLLRPKKLGEEITSHFMHYKIDKKVRLENREGKGAVIKEAEQCFAMKVTQLADVVKI